MAAYKIIVLEIAPIAAGEPPQPPQETKVFEQIVPELNLAKFVREVNTAPRRRHRGPAKSAT